MATEYQILFILFIHWIADFLFQTYNMATNKSKSSYWLLLHVLTYSATWFFVGILFFDIVSVLCFVGATFVFHFITDYITSRWTSYLYTNNRFYGFPAFFSVIGLDQSIHYFQLILCYKIFIGF